MRKILILLIVLSLFLTSCAKTQYKADTSSDTGPKTEKNDDNKGNEENGTEEKDKVETGIIMGKLAPDFTLKDIDGNEVKLSDYRGKTVILNFFGVWCGWCAFEMPGLMNVYQEYKDKNVELLIVDVGDSKDTVIDYLEKNNYNIKPLMDVENKVNIQYRIGGFPTTLILDDKGVIVRRHEGVMEEKALKSILDSIIGEQPKL